MNELLSKRVFLAHLLLPIVFLLPSRLDTLGIPTLKGMNSISSLLAFLDSFVPPFYFLLSILVSMAPFSSLSMKSLGNILSFCFLCNWLENDWATFLAISRGFLSRLTLELISSSLLSKGLLVRIELFFRYVIDEVLCSYNCYLTIRTFLLKRM